MLRFVSVVSKNRPRNAWCDMDVREGLCSLPSAIEYQAIPAVRTEYFNRQNVLRRILLTGGTMLVLVIKEDGKVER